MPELGWVCPQCREINEPAYNECRRCMEARPTEPSWSELPKADEPSCLRTGCILLGIIALVIAIFAAVWLYEFAKVAPYM